MSDDGRQRGVRGRSRPRSVARLRKVGEPNVLSGAAVPNQLPTQVTPPPSVSIAAPAVGPGQVQPGRAAAPTVSPRPSTLDGDTPVQGRRLPTVGTLIFLGFLGLTAFRLVGEFLEGATPTETTPAGPVSSFVAPGLVTFGTAPDDDCGVTGTAVTFSEGTDVFWSAELSTRQGSSATVVVIVRRDHVQIDREVVPPDGSSGFWTVLCSGAPVVEQVGGTYRVEVWNEGVTALYAAGEYQVSSASPFVEKM